MDIIRKGKGKFYVWFIRILFGVRIWILFRKKED